MRVQIQGVYFMPVSLHCYVSVWPVLRVWNLVGVSMCRIHSRGFCEIEKGKAIGASPGGLAHCRGWGVGGKVKKA